MSSGAGGGSDGIGGGGPPMGKGGKKSGMTEKMTKQLPDGVVAVVKGLLDDDNPEAGVSFIYSLTRSFAQKKKVFVS